MFLLEEINSPQFSGIKYENDISNKKKMDDKDKNVNKNNIILDNLPIITQNVNFIDDSTRSQTILREKKADYFKII